jgi:hypothetical protein
MSDDLMIWTTVGSAGTLSAADLAEVSLDKAVITLSQPPTASVTVRYNVTPVAGLFPAGRFHYLLHLTYTGTVRARLGQFNVLTGADTDVLRFDSASFPPAHTFTANASRTAGSSGLLDFVRCAYYVEATLTAPADGAGDPAAIAAVKILAAPDLSG